MENKLQIFKYQSKPVRTLEREDGIWWVLKDVCEILALDSPHKVATRLDEDERNQIPVIDSMGRNQRTTIINEPGLYSVILRSDKPEAKTFKRWVTHEVLPTIRKTGSYGTNESAIHQMETLLHGFIAVVEQMSVVTANLAQITSELTKVQPQQATATVGQAIDESFVFGDNCCKLERAPQQLRVQVDAMLHKMMDEQSMNFSAIARFCLLNGFSISSPAVRTYYERVFTETAV